MAGLEALQAPDAGRNRDADALALRLDLESRIVTRHVAGSDHHLREAVHPASPLGVDPVRRIEALQLAGERDRIARRIEESERPAPLLPAIRFSQNVSASLPSGVSAPTPVTTTRRRSLLATQLVTLLGARSDNACRGLRSPSQPHHIPRPPSTWSTAPVTNLASSEQRKRTAPATSPGSPSRPSGVSPGRSSRTSSGRTLRELGRDVAGRDGVDADAATAELLGERLRRAR